MILPSVIIIGAAMASNITFPKPNKYINAVAAVLIFLSILFGGFFHSIFPWLLLIGVFIYSFLGPFLKDFLKNLKQKGF